MVLSFTGSVAGGWAVAKLPLCGWEVGTFGGNVEFHFHNPLLGHKETPEDEVSILTSGLKPSLSLSQNAALKRRSTDPGDGQRCRG